ncbi:ATP-binding protein [Arachidicoccus ginsenosidivorans]|uniref:ATP-binding protein n=1 Tax=Arachidicoccus ginsenosidivorans TaxID=496057 RepID=UPI001CEF9FE4|nr:ATP-binding protein [Arachidicoccus ginsenosidivorans]
MNIIGRLAEQEILSYRLSTQDPELIAIYGRRRVGKTYLVRTFYADNIVFEFSGIHQTSTKKQLEILAKHFKW